MFMCSAAKGYKLTGQVPRLRDASSMQRSVNADSGYGSFSVRPDESMDMQDLNGKLYSRIRPGQQLIPMQKSRVLY